eukprot:421055-Rhodomonas_salina.1
MLRLLGLSSSISGIVHETTRIPGPSQWECAQFPYKTQVSLPARPRKSLVLRAIPRPWRSPT